MGIGIVSGEGGTGVGVPRCGWDSLLNIVSAGKAPVGGADAPSSGVLSSPDFGSWSPPDPAVAFCSPLVAACWRLVDPESSERADCEVPVYELPLEVAGSLGLYPLSEAVSLVVPHKERAESGCTPLR